MLQRDLGVRKLGMCENLCSGPKNRTTNFHRSDAKARFRGLCANLSSGPKNGTGNIRNPNSHAHLNLLKTAMYKFVQTGAVSKVKT